MLDKHLGGHNGLTHLDEGALKWLQSLGHKRFLDIGCGPGGMVQLAEQLGFVVKGIDGDHTLERYDPQKFIIHDFQIGPSPWTLSFLSDHLRLADDDRDVVRIQPL